MANFLGQPTLFNTSQSLEQNLAKLQAMQQLDQPQKLTGRFGQLAEFVSALPEEKAVWAAQQTVVQEKVSTMLSVFVNKFLFEQGKTQFEEWCKTNNIPIVDDYVDTFMQTAKVYVNPLDTQTKKIAELERIISEIQTKKVSEML